MKNWISGTIIIALIAIVVVNLIGNDKKATSNKETVEKAEAAQKKEASQATKEEDTTSSVEYVAPDFELKTLEGQTVRLSDYIGKKVILNFWATWCPPCKEEVPHMQKVYEKYKDQGFEILAVNVTTQDKGQQAIAHFVEDYGMTFDVLLDEEGIVGETYQVITLPTSYMIDEKGNMVNVIEGPMTEAMMEEFVQHTGN